MLQITKIVNFLKIAFSVATLLAFIVLIENYYTGLDMDILEVEITFIIIFLSLMSLFLTSLLVSPNNKKVFYFILILSFISHLSVNILYPISLPIHSLTGILLHVAFTSLQILTIDYILKKNNIKFSFYIIFIIGIIYQGYSFNTIIKKYKGHQTYNKDKTTVYIFAGELKGQLQYYNMIGKSIDSNMSRDKLKKLSHVFTQVDINSISKNAYILKILVNNGYCEEWKKFKKDNNNTFENTEVIDKRCEL